jgi:hypothetical protein
MQIARPITLLSMPVAHPQCEHVQESVSDGKAQDSGSEFARSGVRAESVARVPGRVAWPQPAAEKHTTAFFSFSFSVLSAS